VDEERRQQVATEVAMDRGLRGPMAESTERRVGIKGAWLLGGGAM